MLGPNTSLTLGNVTLFVSVIAVVLVMAIVSSCEGSSDDPAAVSAAPADYVPPSSDAWVVSAPEEQGLNPALVAALYRNAARLEAVYGVLVFKNDALIGEQYFHGWSPDEQLNIHSVTKSFTSALVGIALEEGCLSSADQRMIEFFPELADQIKDPRKNQITIRQMLQMRAGYPWEESAPELMDLMFSGFRPSNLVDVPLVYDPGTAMQYSNLTTHLLGVIVARACGTDLKSFAEEHLFGPLGIEPGFWQPDWEGYYLGYSDLQLTGRDLAKFGLLYRNRGEYGGEQVVPADWVDVSLETYSDNAWGYKVGRNWQAPRYGYQWWSIQAGAHRYHLAWGHGGEQIALLDDLDMVIVVITDPLHLQHGGGPWRIEKQNLNLMADFIASLPTE